MLQAEHSQRSAAGNSIKVMFNRESHASNRLRIFVILSCFLITLISAAHAVDESEIKAIVRPDGTLLLKGTANYFDLAFGGTDTGFRSDGPVGIKSVTFSEHLMIKGETNSSLLVQPGSSNGGAIAGKGNVVITPSGITNNDYHSKGGWWSWYSQLAQTLALSWKASVPGQMQVLLQVWPDGTISIREQEAFLPAADATDRIETTKESPDLPLRFKRELEAAFAQVSANRSCAYPKGSTAKSAILMATFVADHDLQVSVPDLREFDGLPEDAQSIRIARMCCVLDSAFQFDLADRLRKKLPQALQHKFIPDGLDHEYYSKSKTGFYCIDNGTQENGTNLGELSPFAEKVLDTYMNMKDFAAAERFVKALSSQACISESDLTRTRKLIADHLEFLREFKDAEQLRGAGKKSN